jgi:hypothetical protein
MFTLEFSLHLNYPVQQSLDARRQETLIRFCATKPTHLLGEAINGILCKNRVWISVLSALKLKF